MKRFFWSWFKFLFSLFLIFLAFCQSALAQKQIYYSSLGYVIRDFQSQITINQDTSLTVEEKINVNFLTKKHGIFRVIPLVYTAHGKTIRASFKILAVTDLLGRSYPYTASFSGQGIKIKIGDPTKTIIGNQTYIIKYQIGKVLRRYPEHDELYWNVTGHQWDTMVLKASAIVDSPYAKIKRVECFAGILGTQKKNCQFSFDQKRAQFQTTESLGSNKDLTLVVALDKDNQLKFPGPIKRFFTFLIDNWGYPVAFLPLLIIFSVWYWRGRDKRYLSDNVYYRPEDKRTRTVSLFERPHLPLLYGPINNLTPAQVGTIVDEKVDIQDVVGEILELARLGFLKIKKITRKKLFGKKNDYLFIRTEKEAKGLKDYQNYLLKSLFLTENEVLLSSLKNKFYQYLKNFKKKVYQNLVQEKIFAGNPEKTRRNWMAVTLILLTLSFVLVITFTGFSDNSGPLFSFFLTVIPTIFLSLAMPRKKAWGYSLYRRIQGLDYYLRQGKWRTEIYEKHLFIEEILPLAVCLGVVKRLTKDMAVLGLEPPSYLIGFSDQTFFSRDFNSFSRSLERSLLSSPRESSFSGKSSWSGGSGFSSGGSSGGGFGGGGGGSW